MTIHLINPRIAKPWSDRLQAALGSPAFLLGVIGLQYGKDLAIWLVSGSVYHSSILELIDRGLMLIGTLSILFVVVQECRRRAHKVFDLIVVLALISEIILSIAIKRIHGILNITVYSIICVLLIVLVVSILRKGASKKTREPECA